MIIAQKEWKEPDTGAWLGGAEKQKKTRHTPKKKKESTLYLKCKKI